MNHKLLITCLCMVGLASCHPPIEPNEDVTALHQRFHGKYRPVASVASEAIDVNMDGQSSVNLLSEIRDLSTTDLRVDIMGPGKYREERLYMFYQMWPEQFVTYPFSNREPTTYDSTVAVNYARQGTTRNFNFDAAIKQVLLVPDKTPVPDPVRFAPPIAVTIEAGDRIRVVHQKRIYTRLGWQLVRIETLYERYTTAT